MSLPVPFTTEPSLNVNVQALVAVTFPLRETEFPAQAAVSADVMIAVGRAFTVMVVVSIKPDALAAHVASVKESTL